MLQRLPIFLCILFVVVSSAQNTPADSLKNLLAKEQNLNAIRVSRLLDLSYEYRLTELDSSHFYISKALKVSLAIGDKEQEGMSRMYLAQNFKRKGKYPEGLRQILMAVHLLDSVDAPRQQQLIANSELGIFYQATNDFEKALEVALQNIKLIENDSISPSKGRFYYDAGNCYMKLDQYENAETYYLKAVEICNETNFVQGKMIMIGSLAATYKNMKRFDESETMLLEALVYFEANNQKTSIAASYQQLGQIASMQGFHSASIPHYEKARQLFDEVGNLEYTKNVSQALFIAYSILQDQEKAIAANEVYNSLRDSLETLDRKKISEEMKTKYETEKIALAKDAAEVKSKRNQNYFIGSIIIGVLILLSSLFFFGRMSARKKAELITMELRETQKRLALEKQYRESELKALKSQMNPHFIFNALNSIQEYIILNKKNEASDYLGKFADLIRTYLSHSDTGVISLQEEIESLRMYLDLESLRFEDILTYEMQISDNLSKEMTHIPTMLIQPYVENALKHGLLHKKENRKLRIQFSPSEGGNIQCVIEDNGVGRKQAKEFQERRSPLHKSFAAKATEERLNLLNYGRDNKIGVEIVDLYNENKEARGTKVILSIPIIKH
ncbi:MAG: histidine kinase [Flavobacteriaceae bacterium]|nr:histidine kinase [Flavobacteriaceae bacterium]